MVRMGISVGIVGVGAFGRGFVRMFRKHPQVSRVALCDIIPDRLAAAAREDAIAETYPDLEAVLKSDLDAVAIFTQPWLHAPQAVAAMEAGKHVYSAVPVISLSDGDEMLDWCAAIVKACRRTGMYYMMGETSFYRPEAMFCRRKAGEGTFGLFVHAEGDYIHDIDWPACNLRDVARARWGAQWTPARAGDAPMHYPTHSLGGFLSVTGGRVTELSAMGHADPSNDWHRINTVHHNPFGNETALMRLSCGATAVIKEQRWVGADGHEGFSLFGTKGSLVDSFGLVRWVNKESVGPALSPEEMRDPLPPGVAVAWGNERGETEYGGHGGSHAYLVHEFVTAIVERRQPAVNAWVAARMFVPGMVAHKSAMKGGTLMKVPDFGDPPS